MYKSVARESPENLNLGCLNDEIDIMQTEANKLLASWPRGLRLSLYGSQIRRFPYTSCTGCCTAIAVNRYGTANPPLNSLYRRFEWYLPDWILSYDAIFPGKKLKMFLWLKWRIFRRQFPVMRRGFRAEYSNFCILILWIVQVTRLTNIVYFYFSCQNPDIFH